MWNNWSLALVNDFKLDAKLFSDVNISYKRAGNSASPASYFMLRWYRKQLIATLVSFYDVSDRVKCHAMPDRSLGRILMYQLIELKACSNGANMSVEHHAALLDRCNMLASFEFHIGWWLWSFLDNVDNVGLGLNLLRILILSNNILEHCSPTMLDNILMLASSEQTFRVCSL
jgi:hypothetical protein